jgi:hypothetical protein
MDQRFASNNPSGCCSGLFLWAAASGTEAQIVVPETKLDNLLSLPKNHSLPEALLGMAPFTTENAAKASRSLRSRQANRQVIATGNVAEGVAVAETRISLSVGELQSSCRFLTRVVLCNPRSKSFHGIALFAMLANEYIVLSAPFRFSNRTDETATFDVFFDQR